ncbi:PAS domain S-box protein [Parasediminibacterium sp. JCM 36343]|uniref:PAS domain S-box protein n=1 Tax=Parasediminibacterium sp. JCM 36343 TaxID=3374279 RepID=UPI00397C3805
MHNRLTKLSYVAALVLIVSVIFISYIFINRAINQKEKDAFIINVAGRQRMLSQKITQLSLRLIGEPSNDTDIRSQLAEAVAFFQQSQHALQYGDELQGFPKLLNTPAIDSLFIDLQPTYSNILGTVKQLLLSVDTAHKKALVDSIIVEQAVFLPKMETIVKNYEEESEEKLAKIQSLESRFLVIAITLLIVEAVFIFIPILNKNNSLIKEITKTNDLLKTRNSALQAAIDKEKENKTAIEESEGKFRFIAENTSDGIMVFENGHIIYTSPAYQQILGYTFEESNARNEEAILNLVHPEDVAEVKLALKVIEEEKPDSIRYEFRALHKDGYYVWREDTSNNFYDADGRLLKKIIVARNINKRKEYEKNRVEREQLLSSIFDTVTDAVFVLEVAGERQYCFSLVNKAFETTTGLPMQKIVGSYLHEILPKKALFIAMEKIGEAIKEQKLTRWQETLEYPNKKMIGEISITPIYNQKNECIRLIGSIHDLTDRIKAEEAMAKSHNRLLKLTEKVSAAIYEYELDADGKASFPFMGKAIEQLMPWVTVEKLQQDISLAFSAIPPEDYARFLPAREVSQQNLTVWNQEYRVINSNGSVKWLKATSHPERKENGSTIWYGYLEDITQLKQEETRLKLFESALSNSTEGVVITEVHPATLNKQVVIFANQAFFDMTGYSFEELMDELQNHLRGEDTDTGEIVRLEEAFKTGQPCTVEIINYKKSGEPFWVSIAVAPVADSKGKVSHWVSIQRDVTEQKKNLQNIQQQNAKLRDIAWVQSHIVRAPLARLMGLIDMLENDTDKKADNAKVLSLIYDSAKELDVIVRDIVDKTERI